ncbi:MAG: HDIG domain-containing metalloprotein [Cyanobacteria bacterium P01_A01_bin.135]
MKSFRLLAQRMEQLWTPTRRSNHQASARFAAQQRYLNPLSPRAVDPALEPLDASEVGAVVNGSASNGSTSNGKSPHPYTERSAEPGSQSNPAKLNKAASRGLLLQSRELMTWLGEHPSCSGMTRPKRSKLNRYACPLLLTLAIASLTSAIGYRLYNKPQLSVGTVAPETLRAPREATVEDTETTEQLRLEASQGAIPVLIVDSDVNQRVYQSFSLLTEVGDEYRQQAGPFPFVDSTILSTPAQNYLRSAPQTDWQRIFTLLEQGEQPIDTPALTTALPSQELAILELQGYKRASSADDFSALKQSIVRARQSYQAAVAALNQAQSERPALLASGRLLLLSDKDWTQGKQAMRETLERILQQGIPHGLSPEHLQTAVRAQLTDAPRDTIPLAVSILTNVIRPNLIEDPEQTRLQAEQTAAQVPPEIVEIREGEIIVTAGETIEQSQFVLLDYFGLSRRGIDWVGLVGFAVVVSGSVVVFLLVEQRFHARLRQRDHLLVLMLSLSTPLLVILGLPSTNLPAVGLLVGSFYGSSLGLTVVALLVGLLPVGGTVMTANALLASAAGGLVGSLLAGRLRSREELALLGGAVGLVQGVVYLVVSLIMSTATSPVWLLMLTNALIQAMLGVAWSVIALGVSPYLENLFDLVTPIRMVELSNPNRPMLKRLASEAPGTFQHTLFVASLAEAAARELGANVELVRAGTLYHDIGKMHDPEGFIENQMGTNKHDAIDDPWQSAAIIKKHVSEGLVMARKCRLPGAIQAFIPEHQGTMLITYFYYQAKERAKADPTIQVDEADFRYAGPIPQSRETGIVMLADSCEAALRSLKDATPEEALAMVNRILRARWQDDQLVESGLSRQDMARIASIFVRVWQQYNHKRIPYPKAALTPSVRL